jgi:hypothetical protein
VTKPVTWLEDVWAAAFAKPSRLWRPARSWNLHEWTLLNAAFGRIKDRVESSDMAAFDLHQHLVTGRMTSALRHLTSHSTRENRILLRPRFWQQVKICRGLSGHARVEGEIEGQPLVGGTWIFFVRTADLDKHYPAAPTARQPEPAQPAPEPELVEPPPRRRGPPTKKVWLDICGEIARRCIDPKSGRVQVPENESELARNILQWLVDRDKGQPSESAMREAVRCICAAMRAVQK